MYFAEKLVYLIVRASNQLAVIVFQITCQVKPCRASVLFLPEGTYCVTFYHNGYKCTEANFGNFFEIVG